MPWGMVRRIKGQPPHARTRTHTPPPPPPPPQHPPSSVQVHESGPVGRGADPAHPEETPAEQLSRQGIDVTDARQRTEVDDHLRAIGRPPICWDTFDFRACCSAGRPFAAHGLQPAERPGRQARRGGARAAGCARARPPPAVEFSVASQEAAARARRRPAVQLRVLAVRLFATHGALDVLRVLYEFTGRDCWTEGRCMGMLGRFGVGVAALARPGRGALAAATTDGALRAWHGNHCLCTAPGPGPAACLGVLPSGALVAGGSADGSVHLWWGSDSERPQKHAGPVTCVCVLPGGLWASGSVDGSVALWHAEALRGAVRYDSQIHALCALSGGQLAIGCSSGTVYVQASPGQQRLPGKHICWYQHELDTAVLCMAAQPSGGVVSAGTGGVMMWLPSCECDGGQATATRLVGHTSRVRCVLALEASRHGGVTLASASRDRTVRLWADGRCVRTLSGHSAAVTCLAAMPRGALASGSVDTTVRLWSKAGTCRLVLRGCGSRITALVALPGGVLACGDSDGRLLLWC